MTADFGAFRAGLDPIWYGLPSRWRSDHQNRPEIVHVRAGRAGDERLAECLEEAVAVVVVEVRADGMVTADRSSISGAAPRGVDLSPVIFNY